MMLLVALPVDLSQPGNSPIILLDRMPFYASSTMMIFPG